MRIGPYLRRGPVPEERIVIGKRKWKRYALKAAAYTSPLSALACPECKQPLALVGRLWPCERCAGVFVENAPFEAMVAEIAGEPWVLPAPGAQLGSRACPACAMPMRVESFQGAEIDRCAQHGIWFDDAELAEVLAKAGTDEAPAGVGGWLRRLFFGSSVE
jgi:Zn-finger nucleic acid-binding protein